MSEGIRFCDVAGNHAQHAAELEGEVQRVLASGALILGPEVAAFEAEARTYLGVRFAIGVGSGTDALSLSLLALGVGPDEVLLPSGTFFADLEAVVAAGAVPVLSDGLAPSQLEEQRSERTRAVIAPSLHGAAEDLQALKGWAAVHKIAVIEDACQAFGATLGGQSAGSRGLIGCYSLYPTKVLGGAGDGGLVVTNDEDLAQSLYSLRQHGCLPGDKYTHKHIGRNSRLDAVQAAYLRVKLRHLEEAIDRRRALAANYDRRLRQERWLECPPWREQARDTYYAYALRCGHRDALRAHLATCGIEAPIHFSSPIHRQAAYLENFGSPSAVFPNTEKIADTVLSLPCHPLLTDEDVERVCDSISEFGRAL